MTANVDPLDQTRFQRCLQRSNYKRDWWDQFHTLINQKPMGDPSGASGGVDDDFRNRVKVWTLRVHELLRHYYSARSRLNAIQVSSPCPAFYSPAAAQFSDAC